MYTAATPRDATNAKESETVFMPVITEHEDTARRMP